MASVCTDVFFKREGLAPLSLLKIESLTFCIYENHKSHRFKWAVIKLLGSIRYKDVLGTLQV